MATPSQEACVGAAELPRDALALIMSMATSPRDLAACARSVGVPCCVTLRLPPLRGFGDACPPLELESKEEEEEKKKKKKRNLWKTSGTCRHLHRRRRRRSCRHRQCPPK